MTTQLDQSYLQALNWRCIGPPRGGRVITVAGHPTDCMTFYFGAVGGGVWKTTDGGVYWENITDGYFTSAAVGAIAVSVNAEIKVLKSAGIKIPRTNVRMGVGESEQSVA